jgi:hypothetical protein
VIDGDLRDFCVIELCIIVQRRAIGATDAQRFL